MVISRKNIISKAESTQLTKDANETAKLVNQNDSEEWFDKHTLYKDHINEVLNKWTQIDDNIWGKLSIFNRNQRVAKAYLRTNRVNINSSNIGFDGHKIGLSGFSASFQDDKVNLIKNRIGKIQLIKKFKLDKTKSTSELKNQIKDDLTKEKRVKELVKDESKKAVKKSNKDTSKELNELSKGLNEKEMNELTEESTKELTKNINKESCKLKQFTKLTAKKLPNENVNEGDEVMISNKTKLIEKKLIEEMQNQSGRDKSTNSSISHSTNLTSTKLTNHHINGYKNGYINTYFENNAQKGLYSQNSFDSGFYSPYSPASSNDSYNLSSTSGSCNALIYSTSGSEQNTLNTNKDLCQKKVQLTKDSSKDLDPLPTSFKRNSRNLPRNIACFNRSNCGNHYRKYYSTEILSDWN